MPNEHSLISDIEAFLELTGMGPAYFSKRASGNGELVARLRAGGRVWPETELRVRSFIDDYLDHCSAPAASSPAGAALSAASSPDSTAADGVSLASAAAPSLEKVTP